MKRRIKKKKTFRKHHLYNIAECADISLNMFMIISNKEKQIQKNKLTLIKV